MSNMDKDDKYALAAMLTGLAVLCGLMFTCTGCLAILIRTLSAAFK